MTTSDSTNVEGRARARRTEILDTALCLIAEAGMRGLTHRAVDRSAGLPAGSTSYYFRTRDALVTGCLSRLLELDREQVRRQAAAPAPGGGDDPLTTMVDSAVEECVRMVTVDGHRTVARYELSLHAVRSDALRQALVSAGDDLRGAMAGAMAAFGVARPRQAAEQIAAVLDGLVFTALVRGPREPDQLRAWLREPVHRLLAGQLGESGAPGQSTGR